MKSQNRAVGNDAPPLRRAKGECQRTEWPVEVTQLAGDSAALGPEIRGFRLNACHLALLQGGRGGPNSRESGQNKQTNTGR